MAVATEGVDVAEVSGAATIAVTTVDTVAVVEAVLILGFSVEADVVAQMLLHLRMVFWALQRMLQGSGYGSKVYNRWEAGVLLDDATMHQRYPRNSS